MMTASQRPRQPSSLGRRGFGLLALSLLLHAVVFEWADGYVAPRWRSAAEPPVVTAQLQTEQIAREVVSPPKPAAPVPRKKAPRPRPKPVAPPVPAARAPAESSPPPAPMEPALAGMSAPGSSVESAPEVAPPAPEAEPPSAEPAAAAAPEAPHPAYKFAAPPSAEIKYDVHALREGQNFYGRGKWSWQTDGSRYTAEGEAGVLFFTVLNFKSEGEINNSGVAPILYTEKRFRKSATNTHFHRERNTISFSASEASYPRSGSEQDRATVVWQLAGIGRGDSAKFVPGAEIDLFVAGVRDAETWRIKVVGEEEIEVGGGKISAWHVARAPRPGSYDSKIDIWYAPQQEWYPVRVRYTETNGDYTELSLSSVTLAAAH